MQTLPQHVKVGPVVYKIQEEARTAIDGYYGTIIYAESLITLQPGMSQVQQQLTLWHELFHAMLKNAGYTEHDEQLIISLSHGIVGVLQDNPELLK